MLFDSHCHLTDEAYSEDRLPTLERAREAGVDRIVCVASHLDDARASSMLADRHPGVFATAGLHPHEASRATSDTWYRLQDLVRAPKVVAIGECGLDFHYEHSPRSVQHHVFEAQIELAEATGLPLVIHSRSCDEEMISAVRGLPEGVRGVLHCFSGSDALLEAALERDLHISFTGMVTFKSFTAAHQVRAVPQDRLMIETDAPYLAPVPYRGKRNEPGMLPLIAEKVASILAISPDEVARRTTRNALSFFGQSTAADAS